MQNKQGTPDRKARVRVLLVNASLHHGGAETVVASLCRLLDRSRFDVTVCLLKFRGAIGEDLVREGYNLVEFPRVTAPIVKYLAFHRLRSLIKEGGFDIVHSHCTHSFSESAFCKASGARFRMIHTFHYGNYPRNKFRYKVLEAASSRAADMVVGVGKTQFETIRGLYRLGHRRTTIIWNGVADPRTGACSSPRAPWLQRPGQVIVGSIGNLNPQKGYGELLATADILRNRGLNVKFVVVGGGPLEAELKQECRVRNLEDHVEFLGYVKQAATSALPSFDIFFMPSRWEAMSIALLEAMAAGKAVVATAVGDNALAVESGVSGLIVPPREPEVMAEALGRLIEQPRRRAELAQAGRVRYEQEFRVDLMVRRYEALYRAVLAGSPHEGRGSVGP